MNNKNNLNIAIIGHADQNRKKSTLSEYLKTLNNIPINISINSLKFHGNEYIEELNRQIEIINKRNKLVELENKKTDLINQKRKKYAYILNYTLKNK